MAHLPGSALHDFGSRPACFRATSYIDYTVFVVSGGLMNLRETLKRDAVKALQVLDPLEVEPNASVGVAIEAMRGASVGCTVVTEHRQPIGVFTERDVLLKVLGGGLPLTTPITEVMTNQPKVIKDGWSVATVIRTMHEGGFRHLPVVDASGCLQGVVSVKRVVEYLVDHFPSTVFNLPPDPSLGQAVREGA